MADTSFITDAYQTIALVTQEVAYLMLTELTVSEIEHLTYNGTE